VRFLHPSRHEPRCDRVLTARRRWRGWIQAIAALRPAQFAPSINVLGRHATSMGSADGGCRMKRIITAGIVTVGLVLWAHQLPTIGGRVPMVFVALWFGSATIVALVFSTEGFDPEMLGAQPRHVTRRHLWRQKMGMAVLCLLPLTLVPLLERRGVGNDPAVWLLDCALFISICSVPYFTLVARTAVGGAVLSVGAFQALWICGASVCFVIMKHLENGKGRELAQGGNFEDFFRLEYRYLFYSLCGLMLLGYCPALLWLSHRRFRRQKEVAERHAKYAAS